MICSWSLPGDLITGQPERHHLGAVPGNYLEPTSGKVIIKENKYWPTLNLLIEFNLGCLWDSMVGNENVCVNLSLRKSYSLGKTVVGPFKKYIYPISK